MPLIVFLKQPNRAIAVKGDLKDLRRMERAELGGAKSIIFEKFNKGSALFFKDNISHIEEISEEELKKQRAEYEKKLKQRNGQLVTPDLLIPKRSKN